MKPQNRKLQGNLNILASDLDGTLIPLPEAKDNSRALTALKDFYEAGAFSLIFVTGRHFESVLDATSHFKLPLPGWIICDVGTSIYERKSGDFSKLRSYQEHLDLICRQVNRSTVEAILAPVDGLRLQSKERQSNFKISYYCDHDKLKSMVRRVNTILEEHSFSYGCLGSVDPFGKVGLLDILPSGVNKAYALDWLIRSIGLAKEGIVYAGDSGNDTAALTNGYRSILVGNASDLLRSEIKALIEDKQMGSPIYFAKNVATSGVLEGIQHYGLVPGES